MVIGEYSLFIGAYAERTWKEQSQILPASAVISEEKQRQVTEALKEAMRETGFGRGRDSVSISEEGRAFLTSGAVVEKMQADREELLNGLYGNHLRLQAELQRKDPSDPFWGNTGNQWLVFSEQLYKGGFYDDMTDEQVKQAEALLERITQGMSGLSRVRFNTGLDFDAYSGSEQTDAFHLLTQSAELYLELESSVAALKRFGETMVPDGRLRGEFMALVGQYERHNSQVLDGYRSLSEKMDSAGGPPATAADTAALRETTAGLFSRLAAGGADWDGVWAKIEAAYLDSAAPDGEAARDRQLALAGVSFERMKSYWQLLTGQ